MTDEKSYFKPKDYDRLFNEEDFYFDENHFPKMNSLRKELDLLDEERISNPEDCYSVRRVKGQNGERWDVFKNKSLIGSIEAKKLLKKEIAFLRSSQGIAIILELAKQGSLNVHQLKTRIKSD